MLLQSSKPALHANFDCNALAGAVVSRQISVVRLLLQVSILEINHHYWEPNFIGRMYMIFVIFDMGRQAGVKTDIKVRMGAWSWDMDTGEELRVGAGLAEDYCITWCAVEYFESSGAILHMLFQHISPNILHNGRTLIHHAILCNNARAVELLLNCAVDKEFPVQTYSKTELRPIHLAARLGSAKILRRLISAGCNINSRTAAGETAAMICARYKHEECLKFLASEGADLGLINYAGHCANSIAKSSRWTLGFQQAVVDSIRSGNIIQSSNASRFSPLMFVTQANDVDALKKLIEWADVDLDEQDADGFSAAMIAAAAGHVEAFRLLLHAGANIKLQNKYGETAITLAELNRNGEVLEQVILEYALEEGQKGSAGFYALHRAAKRGDFDLVHTLVSRCYDVNASDADGYTPLMLAAKSGHGSVCQLLISSGAKCDIENARNETALALARENGNGNEAENVILDELALTLVLDGTYVKKHTKCGKGSPHVKLLKMVESAGVLQWGKSRKRNVVCRAAEVGPSDTFRWNRRRKFDVEEPGMFHVVTTQNKEVHFVCQGGLEMADLWVRGIRLVTGQAIFGKMQLRVNHK